MPGVRIVLETSAAERASKDLRKHLKTLGSAAVDNERDFEKLERRLHQKLGADKAEKSVDSLRNSLRLTRTETARFQTSIGDYSGALRTMTQGIRGATIAVTALGTAMAGVALKSLISQGIEFEKTMKAVQAVSRASTEDFERLSKAAREMGASTEWSAQQSGEALRFMAMAGMNTAESISALPGLLDLATAAQMDLATASDITTDSLTAFGMATSEINRFNDALINTSTRANTTVQMLGESFKYVAPVAANMGYSVENTSAMLGVLANSGIKAESAGTSLRQAMLRTGKAAKSLGLSIDASLLDVLEEMKRRQFSVNDVVKEFGIIASTGVTVLMNNVDAYDELNLALETNAGATQKVADMMRDTLDNSLKMLQSTVSDLALELYDLFSEDMKNMVDGLTDSINDNKDKFKELGKFAGDTATTLITVTSELSSIFSTTLTGWNSLPSIIKQFGVIGAIVGGVKTKVFLAALVQATGYIKEMAESQRDLASAAQNSNIKQQTQTKILGNLSKGWGSAAKQSGKYLKTLQDIQDREVYGIDFGKDLYAGIEDFVTHFGDEDMEADFGTWSDGLEAVGDEIDKVVSKLDIMEAAWKKGVMTEEYYNTLLSQFRKEEQEFIKMTGNKEAAYELYIANVQELNNKIHEDEIEAAKEYDKDLWLIRKEGLEKANEVETKYIKERLKAEEKALKKIAAQEKRELEKRKKEYDDFVKDVHSDTSDIIYEALTGGADSAFDYIKDQWKRFLADMAAAALLKPIILPIVQTVKGIQQDAMAAAMGGGVTAPGGGGIFGALNNATGVYNALSGGMETGVYNALTSGMVGDIGSSIFGTTAWAGPGQAATTPATAGIMTAGQITPGITGIAQTIAAAAPYAAIASIAIPLIMDMFESDPEPFLRVQPTSTSRELSDPNYQWKVGAGVSPAGFDFNLTMQDLGGEVRGELGNAVFDMLDAQFTGIENTLNVSINEAIVAVQNRAGEYGKGFFAKIDLREYENDVAGALSALSEDLFQDIRGELTTQLGLQADVFDQEFFKGIAVEGEASVDTFMRFGTTVQESTDFLERFTRQTELLGNSSQQAYNNIVNIDTVMDSIAAAETAMTSTTFEQSLNDQIDLWTQLYLTLDAAGAKQEDLQKTYDLGIESIGVAITGLTSDKLKSDFWNGLKSQADITDFVGTIAGQLQNKLQQAVIDFTIAPMLQTAMAPISSWVGQTMLIEDPGMRSLKIAQGAEWIGSAEGKAYLENLLAPIVALAESVGMAFEGSTDEVKKNTNAFRGSTRAVEASVAQTAHELATEAMAPEGLAEIQAQATQRAVQEFMAPFREEFLPDYAKAIAEINREVENSILELKKLTDSESELSEIRAWGDAKIQEIMDEQIDSMNEYINSFSRVDDSLSDVMDSFESAVEHWVEYIGFAASETEIAALTSSAIAEALAPAIADLESFYDAALGDRISKATQESSRINQESKSLVSQFESLQANFAGLNVFGPDSDLMQFFNGVPQFIDALSAIQLLTMRKQQIQTIGGTKAQIYGMEEEWQLMQISQRWPTAGDLSDPAQAQKMLSAMLGMSAQQIVETSDAVGVSIDQVSNDMLTLHRYLKETADQFRNVSDSLEEYQSSLSISAVSPYSPEKQYRIARASLIETFERAKSSDTTISIKAMNELRGVSGRFLEASQKFNVSQFEFGADFGLVKRILKDSQDIAEEQASLGEVGEEITEQQLDELYKITEQASGININIGSLQAYTSQFASDFSDYLTFFKGDYYKTLTDLIGSMEYEYEADIDADKLIPRLVEEFTVGGITYPEEIRDTLERTTGGVSVIDIPEINVTVSDKFISRPIQETQPFTGEKTSELLAFKYGMPASEFEGAYGKEIADWYQTDPNRADVQALAESLGRSEYELRDDLKDLSKIHGYQSGGYNASGAAIVGEMGRELQITGPARYYSEAQTSSILSDSNSGVEKKLDVLISAIRDLIGYSRSTTINTAEMQDLLNKFDNLGMPTERA